MSAPRGRAVSWLWRDDEEMAKKDDDIRLPAHTRQSGQWQTARAPRRTIIVRLAAYAFAVFLFIFVLSKAIGSGGADSYSQRYDPTGQRPPKAASARGDAAGGEQGYSGAVRFPSLAASIHAIGGTGGNQPQNRNVLFAAASLRSAAELLPMACQMAQQRESYVHFALISRSDIPMKELLKMNGIDDSCQVISHDARPDYPMQSTDTRMSIATARALYHIEVNMHPQAIVVDSTAAEEAYFLAGMRDGIRTMRATLIELPEKASTRMSWITKLDAASLAAWNRVHFDIIVHAPPNSSGNIRRLLRSLSRADIGGVAPPHITIELPKVIEPATETLLAEFQWPPKSPGSSHPTNMLSLRHRIPRQKLNEEESSARFLESFWPANPSNSHVLVLSPHTELTPQFFHYVKYVILRHRYSRTTATQDINKKLMGISFSTPRTLLDGDQPFTPPKPLGDSSSGPDDGSFLWQAPTSDAVLFMGDKWVELHGYVSQVLEKQASEAASPALLAKKEVSRGNPSWLELVLQLSRIRGYVTLYPGRETADVILGVHTELNEKPEEYQGTEDESSEGAKSGLLDQASETFDSGSQVNMLSTLPQGGALHLLTNLPVLSWDGKSVEFEDISEDAAKYTRQFRREVGQCEQVEKAVDKNARDLFCKTTGETA